MDLEGRVAVVTGASKGIGRAIAAAFAAHGARVVLNYGHDDAAAAGAVATIVADGGEVVAMRGDVSVPETAARLVEVSQETWGRLDIWVNNAGADVLTGAVRELPLDVRLRRLLDVDVLGTFYGARAAGEAMRDHGGAIINMAWDHVWHGYASDYGVLFGASKGAVAGMSASLARQLAPRVRVNTIAPGWIKTAWGDTGVGASYEARIIDMTPLARWGVPEDIGQVAVFLASDAASFITGQVIPVNGGVVMR